VKIKNNLYIILNFQFGVYMDMPIYTLMFFTQLHIQYLIFKNNLLLINYLNQIISSHI